MFSVAPEHDYQTRIRSLLGAGGPAPISPAQIAREVIAGSVESLEALQARLPDADFDAAVALMLEAPAPAPALWLVATRRALPVGGVALTAEPWRDWQRSQLLEASLEQPSESSSFCRSRRAF